jgi:PPOX class probable F420-dependent enzyme
VPRIDVSMSPDEVMSLLSAQKTGALATIGKDGFPHQAAMWFISEPGHILMWTYGRSQKAVNLRRDRRASFIVEDGETYDTLRGVLVQGEVELVDNVERVLDIGLQLNRRYAISSSADVHGFEAAIQQQAARRVAVVLPMSRVVSWDHRKLMLPERGR